MELPEECCENGRFSRRMVTAANGGYYRCWISAHGEPFYFNFVVVKFSMFLLIVNTHTRTHPLFFMHYFQRTIAPTIKLDYSYSES